MTTAIQVAALYTLAASSPYAEIDGVDCWPAKRDAMRYSGPWPVVAHPPCAPWSRSVAHQTHKSKEQGPWLAPCAVLQVRRYGGILEQPARSRLWEKMSLPYPEGYHAKAVSGPPVDRWGGYTVEVFQRAWGHPAPKRTWLYVVGVDPNLIILPSGDPSPAKKSDRVRVDKRTGRAWVRSAYDMGSPEGRKRTPVRFAEWLVGLAATVR